MPKIVAQDDVIIRTAQVILDPNTDPERYAAFADYYHVDIPELTIGRRVSGARCRTCFRPN